MYGENVQEHESYDSVGEKDTGPNRIIRVVNCTTSGEVGWSAGWGMTVVSWA